MFGVRYRYIFILLLAVYSYLNIRFTVGERLLDFEVPSYLLFGTLLTVVWGLWELNHLAEKKLDWLCSLSRHRVHPLIVQFLISMLNVALICFVTLELLYMVLSMPVQVNGLHIKLLTAFGFRVNLFLNCINAIVYYMNQLKKSQLEAEQLKKISAESQFEALRNQINPHFLFNCFNVLSSLVYLDADVSAKFIAQLSHVYRYLLYNQDRKVVPLRDELDFLDAYRYLLEIRFGENININMHINCDDEKLYIAPAVLQMLIENAIKHNVVSKRHPLHITLSADTRTISVSNNLQEKEMKEDSTQIGLRNIRQRYAFLSDEPVMIEKTNDHFIVTIPLLQVDNA